MCREALLEESYLATKTKAQRSTKKRKQKISFSCAFTGNELCALRALVSLWPNSVNSVNSQILLWKKQLAFK